MRTVGFDIEGTNLLNDSSIDYTSIPYKLKDDYIIHCVVLTDKDTGEVFDFVQDDVYDELPRFVKEVDHFISHNGINFDHLLLKLYSDMDYTIGPDTFMGRDVTIDDTMIMSKCLNADRFGGHSLDSWGKRLDFPKIEWRKRAIELGLITIHSPKGAEFKVYHPEMLVYCRQDVAVTLKTFDALKEEWGQWNFEDAYQLEKKTADIITRQSHRGFWFDSELAESNIKELDGLLAVTKEKVEPYIPMKKPTKAIEKQYTPPKKQFNKDGKASALLVKFAEKLDASLCYEDDPDMPNKFKWEGVKYSLPLPAESLLKEVVATVDDSTHIKEWLVLSGWSPSEFSEKDISCDTKKRKLSREKYNIAANKYIEQTLVSPFGKDRMDYLKVTKDTLASKLLNHNLDKPLRVLVNPKLTIGQEKEICPHLIRLGDTFPYAKDLAEYYTYKHRRSSILGGGLSFEESGEAEKGYLSYVRADGRVSTPARTCDAASRRMQHSEIANVPRATSLYGSKMRSLFGVEKDRAYLIGADFTSLEAMEESHYVFKYIGGKEYGESLTKEKPNSVHCNNARNLNITRSEAKTVKYLLSYGGQIPRLSKSMGWPLSRSKKVFNGFWIEAKPLKLLIDAVTKYWETTGQRKFIPGLDGGKIYTRSKHSLLNNLLQSAGAICAKRQLVIFEQKLKDNDLLVDFFRDNWHNKSFGQLLIAYHDEAQVEVSKDLVKFKAYDTEEEAKAHNEEGKLYGSVIEKDGKYFSVYSIVGQMLREAAKETSDYYNMNVTLGMDYDVHYHWGGTH